MTRLFVNVKCERCKEVYARDISNAFLRAKSYEKGLCIWCKVEMARGVLSKADITPGQAKEELGKLGFDSSTERLTEMLKQFGRK